MPEQGELFDEIIHAEMDEKNTEKTVRDYKSDGSRAKRMGRDEHSASKRKRYDEQRSSYDRSRDNRYSGSGKYQIFIIILVICFPKPFPTARDNEFWFDVVVGWIGSFPFLDIHNVILLEPLLATGQYSGHRS